MLDRLYLVCYPILRWSNAQCVALQKPPPPGHEPEQEKAIVQEKHEWEVAQFSLTSLYATER